MGESYRLGIDVGGTNTDAVILNQANEVIARAKSPTTEDISGGIRNAAVTVLREFALPAAQIGLAMLSTTHCTNAIVTRRGLIRIGVLRIGAPATTSIPPLVTWPADLREAVLEASCILGGGNEFNGEEIASLDVAAVRRMAGVWKGRVGAVSVTGVFSPVNGEHERRVREILWEVLGADFPVTLSCEIGSIGLLQRENAAALNATLVGVARAAVEGFQRAMEAVGVTARLFLGQNDGTLMSIEQALKFPVLTIASGPANSIRGAGYLSGLRDAIVIDIGGTTSDFGVLHKGFPRESSLAVEVGGVRTNFRMPDVLSIGLGGGSLVTQSGEQVSVGPQSLGYRLLTDSLIFGGTTLTAADLAVRAGIARFGFPERVSHLPMELCHAGLKTMQQMLEDSLDRMKLNAEDVPVIAVGGGSILCPKQLLGASEVIQPRNFDVANAVGVAIAQMSSTVEQVVSLKNGSRSDSLDRIIAIATDHAVQDGAVRETVEVVELEEVPLAYLSGGSVRMRVKVAGNIKLSA